MHEGYMWSASGLKQKSNQQRIGRLQEGGICDGRSNNTRKGLDGHIILGDQDQETLGEG